MDLDENVRKSKTKEAIFSFFIDLVTIIFFFLFVCFDLIGGGCIDDLFQCPLGRSHRLCNQAIV